MQEASFNPPQHLLRPAQRPLPAGGGARAGTQEGPGAADREETGRSGPPSPAVSIWPLRPALTLGGRSRPLTAAALCFRGCVAARSELSAPPPAPAVAAGLDRDSSGWCGGVCVQHLPAPHPRRGRPLLQPPHLPLTLVTHLFDNLRSSNSGGHQGTQQTASVSCPHPQPLRSLENLCSFLGKKNETIFKRP